MFVWIQVDLSDPQRGFSTILYLVERSEPITTITCNTTYGPESLHRGGRSAHASPRHGPRIRKRKAALCHRSVSFPARALSGVPPFYLVPIETCVPSVLRKVGRGTPLGKS